VDGWAERVLTRRLFVLARHGETHEIPVRYALNAAEGSDDPDAPHHAIANTTPYLVDEARLLEAASRLARRAM
jgi:hypothetical protein